MHLTPVITPKLVKKIFPNLVWELPKKDKSIYLTFDDGPTAKITEWTLDILKQFDVKATFFCIGKNVVEHPELFNKIITDGHTIGNHTYNHLKGWKTKTKKYLENVTEAQEVIDYHLINSKFQIPNFNKSEISNRKSQTVNLFRPPYGQIKPKHAHKLSLLGYKIIMWSVLSMDYDNTISKEKCLKNVIDNTCSGDIVVFHDSIKALRNMQYTLPKVLEYYSKRGYLFKRIPE